MKGPQADQFFTEALPNHNCDFSGWATTMYTGSQSRFAYLPIPKSGSTYLRGALAPLLGFQYTPEHSVVQCTNISRRSRGEEAAIQTMLKNRVLKPLNSTSHRSCFRVGGNVPVEFHVQMHSREKKTTFTVVTEPLKHLYHGFAQMIPREISGDRSYYSPQQFMVDAAALWGSCTQTGLATIHKRVHVVPQAWHISNSLKRITESGGVNGHLDFIWKMEDEAALGFPELSRLLNVSSIFGEPQAASQGNKLDERIAGDLGWEILSKMANQNEMRALCLLLQADYERLDYVTPAHCSVHYRLLNLKI